MSTLTNAIYIVGLSAASMYTYENVDKQSIDHAMLALNMQEYKEVDELLVIKKVAKSDVSTLKYRNIPMNDMESWTPAEYLAKMMFTERNTKHHATYEEYVKELYHVAASAMNCVLLRNSTLAKVCTDKRRYSGVMREHNKHWMRNPSKTHMQVAHDIIEQYKDGIPDAYADTYSFCNFDWVRDNNGKAAKWFRQQPELFTLGNLKYLKHTFYANKKWEKIKKKKPNMKFTIKHLS